MKLFFLTIAFLSISIPSFAQQAAQSTGDFNYWATYSYDKEGDKICYMFTTPTKSSVKIPGRGDTFLVVTNNLAEATFGIVNIQSGFKYKKDVPVTVKIGKEIFTFTSFGDMAWVKDGDDKVVNAMIKGNFAEVSGETEDGKKVTDTFSLSGFTKANKQLNKICAQ